MKLFRFLFGFDALGLLVLLYFFLDGLQYATGSGTIYWLFLLGIPAGLLALAWSLKGKGKVGTANILLGVLAVPGVFALFFVGLFIFFPPDFR